MDATQVYALSHWPPSKILEELQFFLGLAGFYRKYVHQYALITVPMADQLKEKGKNFTWGVVQQESFDKIKIALAKVPILSIIDTTKPFVVETDASD